jgi:dihydrofolate reductase
MRTFTVLSMITLDGVMQAPGGPEEDVEGQFPYGGWVAPFGDEMYSVAVRTELQQSDYLLGRKTFEIWENYWPHHGDFWPGINRGMKYILSTTRRDSAWANTSFVQSVQDIKAMKKSAGADVQIWGSSELVQLLLQHDLVDEFRLKLHPVVLGRGKRLFADSARASAYTLAEHVVTTTGVIIARYVRNSSVRPGSMNAV